VSWSRTDCAAALAAAIQAQFGETVVVYPKPPQTINPPAIVVGYPAEVRYTTFAFGVDEADLPVLCIGPLDGPEMVDDLIQGVRAAVNGPDLTLGGVVQGVGDTFERNWRPLNVAGIDVLQAEVALTIQM
jgi:hypothetical protein